MQNDIFILERMMKESTAFLKDNQSIKRLSIRVFNKWPCALNTSSAITGILTMHPYFAVADATAPGDLISVSVSWIVMITP